MGGGELAEEFLGTGNLASFYLAQVEGLHAALGLSHEIDVLHTALLKGYCPVGRVVAYGGGEVESLGQYGIHHHLLSRIEVLHKLAFHALGGISVGKDIIHDALPALVGFVHRGVLLLGENVAGVFAI